MCVNTPEQRIAVLAALHCGAVVYPCNQLYTTDELNRQFSIKKPDVIIVDSQFLSKIYDVKGEVPDNKIYVIGESKVHKTYNQLVDDGSVLGSTDILRNDDDTIIFLLQSS
uniref:AMP-dependent synthetase/ligase domain-containing protein n=1 Tax=Ciona savignyi TaxID=51511 RepID=H2Z786_CIOSA